MAVVRKRNESIQYDGTNSAAVLAFLSDVTFHSETGGMLQFEDNLGNGSVQLFEGDWLVRSVWNSGQFAYIWCGTSEMYQAIWIES